MPRLHGRWTRPIRPLVCAIGFVAVVVGVGWTLGDPEAPSLEGPISAAARAEAPTTSATIAAGDPIKELPRPAAIDIRNEIDGLPEITIAGVAPQPITVRQADKPKIRAVASGEITIDVLDRVGGQVLVRQAALRLLPDETTTLVVRRDASGAIVLAAAP